jgi:hypothetical protein
VHNSKAPAPPSDPINLDRSGSEALLQQSIGNYSNWKDIFMLRASPKHLMRYNVACPIPVIGEPTGQQVPAKQQAFMPHHMCCRHHRHHSYTHMLKGGHATYMQRLLMSRHALFPAHGSSHYLQHHIGYKLLQSLPYGVACKRRRGDGAADDGTHVHVLYGHV